MAVILYASTSSGFVQSADTSGEINLQSNGTTRLSVLSTGVSGTLVQGTAVASTSGTSIDFTGIPSWVRRITVMFSGVSTNGASNYQIQIGAGSFTTSGYISTCSSGAVVVTSTAGFISTSQHAATLTQAGILTISTLGSNAWCYSSVLALSNASATNLGGGNISLGGTLDRVRITTVNGTDTFDAGTINIQYEG
jgi:hypothetical protein